MSPGWTTAETNALTAVMDQDYVKAEDILTDFHPGELRDLIKHLESLREIADQVLRGKSSR